MMATLLYCGGGKTQAPGPALVHGFQRVNLVSDVPGTATHTDQNLLNPWGAAFVPGQPFFIAENARGKAGVFDPSGTPSLPLAVAVPIPLIGTPPSKPTGVVFN